MKETYHCHIYIGNFYYYKPQISSFRSDRPWLSTGELQCRSEIRSCSRFSLFGKYMLHLSDVLAKAANCAISSGSTVRVLVSIALIMSFPVTGRTFTSAAGISFKHPCSALESLFVVGFQECWPCSSL